MSFADLQKHVEENVFLDEFWFAEPIVLRTDDGDEIKLTGHSKYSCREDQGVLIETLAVSFLKDELPAGCDHKHRLYRAGDERAFLFRFNGTDTANRWRTTFERRTQKRQGAK